MEAIKPEIVQPNQNKSQTPQINPYMQRVAVIFVVIFGYMAVGVYLNNHVALWISAVWYIFGMLIAGYALYLRLGKR